MDDKQIIHESFTADFDTGEVFWKERPRSHFSSEGFWRRNTRESAGQPVKFYDVNGHGHRAIRFRVFGASRTFLLHRIVWCLAHGDMPKGWLDHINNDPGDNRLVNLRLVTPSQNAQNARRRKPGLKGAYRNNNRWQSRIWNGERHINLGRFLTEQEAHEAYVAAALQIRGPFHNPGYENVFD